MNKEMRNYIRIFLMKHTANNLVMSIRNKYEQMIFKASEYYPNHKIGQNNKAMDI